MEKKLLYWFEELDETYNDIVGKKCANLGKMLKLGMNVPPGFALSLDMYREFIKETGLELRLNRYIAGLGDLKNAGVRVFENISKDMRNFIEGQEMPKRLREMILENYHRLCELTNVEDLPVSVRSAGTESRPGMFETYLNVKGDEDVIDKVKRVWASSFTPRAISFRIRKELPLLSDELGVAIVKMVNARCSGICFTVDPVTGDDTKILIEANWGLGEGVVSGAESVDGFVIDKASLDIINSHIGRKSKAVVFGEKGAKWVDLPLEMQDIPCIDYEQVREIAKIAKEVEAKLGVPQDTEWAIDKDILPPKNLFWLQTRPAKAYKKKGSTTDELAERITNALGEIDLSKAKDKVKNISFRF